MLPTELLGSANDYFSVNTSRGTNVLYTNCQKKWSYNQISTILKRTTYCAQTSCTSVQRVGTYIPWRGIKFALWRRITLILQTGTVLSLGALHSSLGGVIWANTKGSITDLTGEKHQRRQLDHWKDRIERYKQALEDISEMLLNKIADLKIVCFTNTLNKRVLLFRIWRTLLTVIFCVWAW